MVFLFVCGTSSDLFEAVQSLRRCSVQSGSKNHPASLAEIYREKTKKSKFKNARNTGASLNLPIFFFTIQPILFQNILFSSQPCIFSAVISSRLLFIASSRVLLLILYLRAKVKRALPSARSSPHVFLKKSPHLSGSIFPKNLAFAPALPF